MKINKKTYNQIKYGLISIGLLLVIAVFVIFLLYSVKYQSKEDNINIKSPSPSIPENVDNQNSIQYINDTNDLILQVSKSFSIFSSLIPIIILIMFIATIIPIIIRFTHVEV